MSVLDNFIDKHDNNEEYWLSEISNMISDQELYGYAEDTLIGIYEHVERLGEITQGQITAVTNIKNNPSNPYARKRYKRRY